MPRRALPVAVVSGLLVVSVVTYGRWSDPIVTDSDFALTELYVELATRGQLLVGPYSRFGWHHPGPLYFYAVAPLYALSGHQAAALYAAAAAINLAAIAAILGVLAQGSRPLAASVAAACAAFAWRVPRYLASPWTAHVPVLPAVAFLVLAAAVTCGRVRLLPWMIAFGSFAAQTHVGFVPVVVITSAAVLLTVLRARSERAGARRPVVWSAGVAVILWFPTLADAVMNQGGNLAALWEFFVADAGDGHSLREAAANGSYGVMSVFRPDFELPWGGHHDLNDVNWTLIGSAVELLLLVVVGWWHVIERRRFEAHLAIVAVAATTVGVLSLMRVQGDVLNHDLFRIGAIGALNLGIIAAGGLHLVARAVPPGWHRPAGAIAIVVVAIVTAAIAVRDLQSLTAFERRQRGRLAIVAAHDAVRNHLAAIGAHKPIFHVGVDRWGDAGGVLLRLVQDGIPAAVKDGEAMFTEHFRVRGDEDVAITLADAALDRELRAMGRTTVLVEASPLFVHASPPGATVR